MSARNSSHCEQFKGGRPAGLWLPGRPLPPPAAREQGRKSVLCAHLRTLSSSAKSRNRPRAAFTSPSQSNKIMATSSSLGARGSNFLAELESWKSLRLVLVSLAIRESGPAFLCWRRRERLSETAAKSILGQIEPTLTGDQNTKDANEAAHEWNATRRPPHQDSRAHKQIRPADKSTRTWRRTPLEFLPATKGTLENRWSSLSIVSAAPGKSHRARGRPNRFVFSRSRAASQTNCASEGRDAIYRPGVMCHRHYSTTLPADSSGARSRPI